MAVLVPKFAVVELAYLFRLMSPSFPVASAFPSVECKLMIVPLPGAHAGGGSGGSGEPPFFQINYIHSMTWHACLACK